MKTTKKLFNLALAIILVICTMPIVYAENETYEVGDLIQFGSYPQSQVKDEALISTLGNLAPYWDECTSYRYYSGNGEIGSMTPGDWMKYADVTYNGNTYRGVSLLNTDHIIHIPIPLIFPTRETMATQSIQFIGLNLNPFFGISLIQIQV